MSTKKKSTKQPESGAPSPRSMKNMSLKISPDLESQLEARARIEGISKSSLVREAVSEYLVHDGVPAGKSFLDQARDLAGCLEGPEDLSVNPAYLATYGGSADPAS